MTTRQQSVDQLEGAIRDYVKALMDHREGRIAVGPTVVTAQQNLRTAGTTTSAAGRLRIG
jgi:hypothetical protein